MAEQLLSMVSTTTNPDIMATQTPTSMATGSSGHSSTTNNDPSSSSNKRKREDLPASSTRYKGVVLQQNGHWGAQIYANHRRIWLGTFKTELAAARAYDSAAIKLRSGDSHRNVALDEFTAQESSFQDAHTEEGILNMIKDGSYMSKFLDFVMFQSQKVENKAEVNLGKGVPVEDGFSYQQLFEKELTPSDVGKLNRLVIPKKYAIKYFPPVAQGSKDDDEDGGEVDDMQLIFCDRQMKVWRFRYCYWKSSQSFVFTRGWNRFVKEKELKAKDVITFYRCERPNHEIFCMIDVEANVSEKNNEFTGGVSMYGEKEAGLQLGIASSSNQEMQQFEEEEKDMGLTLEQPLVEQIKGVYLFGAKIG